MQKHKFSVTCPDALFVEPIPVLPSMKKSASTFHARTDQIALRDLLIQPDAKMQVRRNVSRCAFDGNHNGLTQA
jgi:hypothetical protein